VRREREIGSASSLVGLARDARPLALAERGGCSAPSDRTPLASAHGSAGVRVPAGARRSLKSPLKKASDPAYSRGGTHEFPDLIRARGGPGSSSDLPTAEGNPWAAGNEDCRRPFFFHPRAGRCVELWGFRSAAPRLGVPVALSSGDVLRSWDGVADRGITHARGLSRKGRRSPWSRALRRRRCLELLRFPERAGG
jgi:hypothetical protein